MAASAAARVGRDAFVASEPSLEGLVEALRRLPGVGVKSAQRMALAPSPARPRRRAPDRRGAAERGRCAFAIASAATRSPRRHVCSICRDPSRDVRQLAVVETPADQAALERTRQLSRPLLRADGPAQPARRHRPDRDRRARAARPRRRRRGRGGDHRHQLHRRGRGDGARARPRRCGARGIRVTRLARGVPIGSELEYVDLGTIAHAFVDRR